MENGIHLERRLVMSDKLENYIGVPIWWETDNEYSDEEYIYRAEFIGDYVEDGILYDKDGDRWVDLEYAQDNVINNDKIKQALDKSEIGVHSILVLHTTTNPARFIYNNNLQSSEFEIDDSDIDGCYRINFFSWNSDEKFLEDKTVKEVYYE